MKFMKDTYTKEEVTEILSKAIEDRAKWFALVVKNAKEKGYDMKDVAEKSIWDFGVDKGNAGGPDCKTADEFLNVVHSGPAVGAFQMDIIKEDPDESVIEFNACPLVDSWKKLGCSDDEIAQLCDYASCGDYGMISVSPDLNLEFPELISKGGKCCRMVITKK